MASTFRRGSRVAVETAVGPLVGFYESEDRGEPGVCTVAVVNGYGGVGFILTVSETLLRKARASEFPAARPPKAKAGRR